MYAPSFDVWIWGLHLFTEATWERLVGSRGVEIVDIVSQKEGRYSIKGSRGLLVV